MLRARRPVHPASLRRSSAAQAVRARCRAFNLSNEETSMPAVTIQTLQEAAAAKGGECLSTAYVNSRGPLLMQCAAGHMWTSTANRLRRGHWCPTCAADRQGLGLEPYREFAESKGGRCLSTTYAGANSKMTWMCAKGHAWTANGANVRVNGTWCPQCAQSARSAGVGLVAHQEVAAARGGLCLSSAYKNTKSKMTWQCALGHRWLASGGHVRAGTWCPTCAKKTFRKTASQ